MSERHLINLSTAWMPPDPGSGPVAAGERWRHDVTAKLAARNELQLAAAAGATATMPAVPIPVHGRCDLPADVGRVVLEIEPAGHASYHA
jgi:hypothetical protein